MRTSAFAFAALCALAPSLFAHPHGPAARQSDALQGTVPPPHSIWLDSLDVSGIQQGWGQPHAGRSVGGAPITLHGMVFAHGVGTYARSEFNINLG